MDITKLEDKFRINSYNGQVNSLQPFEVINGIGNVMVSVPHCCKHFREGQVKPHEFMTGAIGQYVQQKTNCHLITSIKYAQSDPNWDGTSQYREALTEYMHEKSVCFLIDIHGMTSTSSDLEIGYNSLKNINNSKGLKKTVVSFWEGTGLSVAFDKKFKASSDNNICRTTNERLKAFTFQIEISQHIRLDKSKTLKFADYLVEFINNLNNYIIFEQIEKSRTNESWWPQNYIVLSPHYAHKFGVLEGDLLSFDFSSYETINSLKIIVTRDNASIVGKAGVSETFFNLISRIQSNSDIFIFQRIRRYPVINVLKIDSANIDDNYIKVNPSLFNEFKKNEFKSIKVTNFTLGITANFRYSIGEEKKNTSIWMNQKDRSMLGIEIKKKYHWHEYNRIINLLENNKFMSTHKDVEYLLCFFKDCYFPTDNYKEYERFGNAEAKLNLLLKERHPEFLSAQETNSIKMSQVRRDFKKLFPIDLFGSAIGTVVPNNHLSDALVGFSKGRFITGRIEEFLEGTNNVRINGLTATLLDVQNNERLIIYHGKKKTDCRVVIDERSGDMEIQLSKKMSLSLNIYQERTFIDVKRDSGHILMKKLDSMILSIALTSFAVITFFNNHISGLLQVGTIVTIWFLIISSTFADRRKNVK